MNKKYALHYIEYDTEHITLSNNKSILIDIARKHGEPATVCETCDGYILYENKAQKKVNKEMWG